MLSLLFSLLKLSISHFFVLLFSLCSLMSLSSNSLLIIIIICFLRGYSQVWTWKIEEAFIFFEESKKWERKRKRKDGGREEEDFHVDGWILKYIIFYDRGYVPFSMRWEWDIFLIFHSLDSITSCSWEWVWKNCGDSLEEWSFCQWKRCKNLLTYLLKVWSLWFLFLSLFSSFIPFYFFFALHFLPFSSSSHFFSSFNTFL